jgi:hypothetical protein
MAELLEGLAGHSEEAYEGCSRPKLKINVPVVPLHSGLARDLVYASLSAVPVQLSAGKATFTVATVTTAIMEMATAMDVNCVCVKTSLLTWLLISSIATIQRTITVTIVSSHAA